ncbi:hypothetical protein [Rhizorhabdus dicambivorans]|uniref:Uncharacterized protein n=1 Tax=Rhizorhabdus dicambivorans TaxID=1850238 RepID=A0A2A4FZ02_9SPHN|nr:hypothetical protein [Rhizorhabdus dicambivorans]ATE64070.1 hypothetical protein CMV14_06425 [Rhizorhabdus dicambivorans]PCE42657.1 hypothetical protein COO09_09650 [Rhizorhabdus dicambivorans]
MNRILTKLVAALTVGSAIAVAVPAEARDWRGDRGGWSRGDRHGGGDRWRGDRWRGDRHWRGDRGWGRGYGYYAPRGRYYAPRYYGYGYGYPRHRHYYRDGGGDALVGALAGIAIGAAIASSD